MLFDITDGVLIGAKPESNCYDKQVVLPSGIKEIGPGSFRGIEGIEHIVLPQGVKIISEGAFAFCRDLKTISLPEGITEIQSGAFAYSGITNVVFPDSLELIGRKAFTNSRLHMVKIPDRVIKIGYGAFSYCGHLHSVEIGTGLKEIDRKTFFGSGLQCVQLSENIEHIDDDAFGSSPQIKFFVKKGSYAYNYALNRGYPVKTDSFQNYCKRINKDLLLAYQERNYLNAAFSPDNDYSISVFDELPIHFYCLIEQESVFRIHKNGFYIPSLLESYTSSENWTDRYFFTEKRPSHANNRYARIKISLRHNSKYINDTTGEKQVRVLKSGDSFLFCDAVHLFPDQCYFLDPYICSESDMQFETLQLGGSSIWSNICHLIIPDGFVMVNDCACSGAQNLESVYVGESVTYIGNDSFCRCPKLTTAYIGGSVEASHTRAFLHCPVLHSVTLSSRHKDTILRKRAMCRQSDWPWFIDCPQLKRVYFDDGTSIEL